MPAAQTRGSTNYEVEFASPEAPAEFVMLLKEDFGSINNGCGLVSTDRAGLSPTEIAGYVA